MLNDIGRSPKRDKNNRLLGKARNIVTDISIDIVLDT